MLQKLLLCCALLGVATVFCGREEVVDFSGIDARVLLKSDAVWRGNFNYDSPEIISKEHGVTLGKKKTTCNCGIANRRSEGRIVGGRSYNQFEYPFLAAISYSRNPLRPHCGASIISSKHLLTAAHCTEKAINGITLFATIAEHERGRTPGAYTVPVEKFIQHEQYDTNTLHHDISLLVLKNNLIMSGAAVPVCMPKPGLDVTGQYVRAVGWGATRFKGAMTSRPLKVDLRVIDSRDCHNMWPINVIKSPKKQICTLSRQRTTCQGDSGGPAVWLDPETNRYTLVGVVSAGPACTDVKPSVYTSVADYMDWIMKGIEATTPGHKCCTKAN